MDGLRAQFPSSPLPSREQDPQFDYHDSIQDDCAGVDGLSQPEHFARQESHRSASLAGLARGVVRGEILGGYREQQIVHSLA